MRDCDVGCCGQQTYGSVTSHRQYCLLDLGSKVPQKVTGTHDKNWPLVWGHWTSWTDAKFVTGRHNPISWPSVSLTESGAHIKTTTTTTTTPTITTLKVTMIRVMTTQQVVTVVIQLTC
jgi:hypothetical protein